MYFRLYILIAIIRLYMLNSTYKFISLHLTRSLAIQRRQYRVISEFNWQRAFLNTTVDEKVGIFTKTVFNIISNFIPDEKILCNGKDPPWFNKKIRTLIKEKNTAFNRYNNNSFNLELERHLKFLQENLNTSIESSKQRYYNRIGNKLNNTQKNSRSYWSLMKIFFNNKKYHLHLLYTMRIVSQQT